MNTYRTLTLKTVVQLLHHDKAHNRKRKLTITPMDINKGWVAFQNAEVLPDDMPLITGDRLIYYDNGEYSEICYLRGV